MNYCKPNDAYLIMHIPYLLNSQKAYYMPSEMNLLQELSCNNY